MSTIHEASRSGDLDAVRGFIDSDPNLVDADDEHKWRPIFHAALRKHAAVVRYLLESGADVAAHNGDALHYAAEVPNNQEVVTLLVQYGAIDAHTQPANQFSRQLLAAIFLNDDQRVQKLIELHPEIATQPDGRGSHPIHHAARNGSTKIVKLLINAGASANASTPRGHTVLYCAAGHGHCETVELLLEQNADRDAKFTHDGKNVVEWLRQFPDDSRLVRVRELIESSNG